MQHLLAAAQANWPMTGWEATVKWLANQIGSPVAIVLPDGKTSPCNAALERLLAREGERDRRRLREALRMAGWELRAAWLSPTDADRLATLEVRTSRRRYVLQGTLAPRPGALPGMIRVQSSRGPLAEGDLLERFGLTRREAEVACLLAAGATNKTIATELHLSPHTARRHTENVFRKVGVKSRAMLGARLYGD